MMPGTEHAVSPRRSSFYRQLIEDWLHDPVTEEALAVLPEWIRWPGELSGVPADLLDVAISAASAQADITENHSNLGRTNCGR
jgi:hypothetical protein